jgi:hypothetical protein
MYFRIADHDTEYCLTLLTRIQEKRNQNNQNVQWIVVETREYDGNKINIVTRGGTKKGADAADQNQNQHQWVKKNTTPQQHLDVQKEKETFKEAEKEIMKENIACTSGTNPGDDVPVYDMPHLFDETSRDKSPEQVT